MTITAQKEIEVFPGFWVEVAADFEAYWSDQGIGRFEMGSKVCYDHDYVWEFEQGENLRLCRPVKSAAQEYVDGFNRHHNRRWVKQCRQAARHINRVIDTLDADEIFTNDELIDKAGETHEDSEY